MAKIDFVPTFLAVSRTIPKEGESYQCSRMECINGNWRLISVATSTVQQVEQIADHTYRVTTLNSVYITEVQ